MTTEGEIEEAMGGVPEPVRKSGILLNGSLMANAVMLAVIMFTLLNKPPTAR